MCVFFIPFLSNTYMSASLITDLSQVKPNVSSRVWDEIIDNNCSIGGTLTLANLPTIPTGAANTVYSSNGTSNAFRSNPTITSIGFSGVSPYSGGTLSYVSQETISLGVTYSPDSYVGSASTTFSRVNNVVTCCIHGTVSHVVTVAGGQLILGNIPINYLPAVDAESNFVYGLGSNWDGTANTIFGGQLVRVYTAGAGPTLASKIVLSYDSLPTTQSLNFTEICFSYRC